MVPVDGGDALAEHEVAQPGAKPMRAAIGLHVARQLRDFVTLQIRKRPALGQQIAERRLKGCARA